MLSQADALSELQDIYKVAQAETWVQMDFSDVPNILCQTDKYLRARRRHAQGAVGGKPRRLAR